MTGLPPVAVLLNQELERQLWPISGTTYFSAERPLSDDLAAFLAARFLGAATVDLGRQLK